MEINATLIHHLEDRPDIYAWRAMILDTDTMEAHADESVDDYWNMDELMERINEHNGWLELRVADPDGTWAQGAGQPDYTSADTWLIPAVLTIDEGMRAEYDDAYGEGNYVTVVELDA